MSFLACATWTQQIAIERPNGASGVAICTAIHDGRNARSPNALAVWPSLVRGAVVLSINSFTLNQRYMDSTISATRDRLLLTVAPCPAVARSFMKILTSSDAALESLTKRVEI